MKFEDAPNVVGLTMLVLTFSFVERKVCERSPSPLCAPPAELFEIWIFFLSRGTTKCDNAMQGGACSIVLHRAMQGR